MAKYFSFSKCLSSFLFAAILSSLAVLSACSDDDTSPNETNDPSSTDYTDLLSNQVNEIIIPAVTAYQSEIDDLLAAVTTFANAIDASNLSALQSAYQDAYLAYQVAAVHNYFANASQALVVTTNLYPVDTALLSNLIANRVYNFNTSAQQRANGFPAIDYLLYAPTDPVTYFNEDVNRIDFLRELVSAIKTKADAIATQWKGNLKANFIANGGTELSSSISIQLNENMVYYEDHIRENKVGIPIGRLGPNDSPIQPDPTKIEGYYQSLAAGDENFTLSLLRTTIEEIEDLYLGESASGNNGQGYDDLLISKGHSAVDADIKAQFASIYNQISNRTSISGNDSLYLSIQEIVALYKSDLFPLLNVQDADGANDGD